MVFANPIVVTINAVAKSFNKINNDNFGSEYLCRESLAEYRIKIRHSKEASKNGATAMDRHNVELTWTIYATSTTPEIVRQIYVVVRNAYSDDPVPVKDLGVGLSAFLNATAYTDLIGWLN